VNYDVARSALRRQLRDARAGLTPAQRIAAAQSLATQLEALPEFLVDQRVGIYWAVDGELALHAAVAQMRRRGQQLYLPVIEAERRLRFAPYSAESTLAPNRHGIPEPQCDPASLLAPEQLQLVLVPLLGFDRHGHRLGFGGGFYDTSFSFLHEGERPREPLLVGIGYAAQELTEFAPQKWDVRLDFIATERELIDCSGVSGGGS
jgi:5-formyltetrahydrofolate cyclo-ligase